MKKSILAGFIISLGCVTFINVPNPVVGSLLFSLGLLSVCFLGLNLYTGKVGYANDVRDFYRLPLMFLGNAVGCLLMAVVSAPIIDPDRIQAIVTAKLAMPVGSFALKGIVCGALMFLGVHAWKTAKLWPVTVLCVMAFILGGAEHSVADTYYFLAGECPLDGLTRILAAVVGNALGAILCYRLQE